MDAGIAGALREVARRVRREHRAIQGQLDELVTKCAQLRLGAVPQHAVEGAIYDLYVRLDEHLSEEERLLRPLVSRLEPDVAARVYLTFSEHDDQRTLLLAALEQTEQGALRSEELVELVGRLVDAFRADIKLEEELFVDLCV